MPQTPLMTNYGTGRPLIIIAGQSQARGHGDTFYLDNQYDLTTPYKSVSLNTQIGADAVSPITWSIFGTTPLQPYSTPGTPSMGYELTLGRALWNAGRAPFIGKFTVDASGLDAHWLPTVNFPTSPAGRNLFGQLCEYIDFRQTETGSTLAVLIWDQGGTDSIDSGPASRYLANLRAFMAELRAKYGQFALVLTELNDGIPPGVGPHLSTVRAAQVAYAATDPNCYLVNTDDVPLGGAHVDSTVHFDAVASAAIGFKLAETIAPLIDRETDTTAPTFIGAAPADFGAGALVPTWNIDGGYEAGDIAILAVTGGQTNATHSLSDAQGFSQIATVDSLFTTLHQRLTLYWCRATSSSMPSPTVADISDFQMAKIFVFRGCAATGNPYDVTASAVNNTYGPDVSLPGLTTLTDRSLIAMFSGTYCAAQSNPLSKPASQDLPDAATRVQSGTNQGSGNFQIIYLVTGEKRIQGALSAVALTTTFSSINANITIALKPAQ